MRMITGIRIVIGIALVAAMSVLWYLGYRNSCRKKKGATVEDLMQEIIETKLWLYGVLLLLVTERMGSLLSIV